MAVRLGVSRGDALHELRARLLERLGVPSNGLFYLHYTHVLYGPLYTRIAEFRVSPDDPNYYYLSSKAAGHFLKSVKAVSQVSPLTPFLYLVRCSHFAPDPQAEFEASFGLFD